MVNVVVRGDRGGGGVVKHGCCYLRMKCIGVVGQSVLNLVACFALLCFACSRDLPCWCCEVVVVELLCSLL